MWRSLKGHQTLEGPWWAEPYIHRVAPSYEGSGDRGTDMPKESSGQVNQTKGCLGVQEGISERVTHLRHLLLNYCVTG